jgi:eukaryotic-like serine/threonine-protein kinase
VTEVDRSVVGGPRPDERDGSGPRPSAGIAVTERRIGGRWKIQALIGQGGMADVYRAVDAEDGGAVALKLLRSPDPVLARRLANEARTLESFDHPNLVRLLGTGIDEGCAYLVTELVDGPTLGTLLRNGPIPAAQVAAMGAALAGALAYVHARGVVHRDVKPANVLLGPGNRVRLADFGIARLVEEVSLTATGSTIGTTAYMAPEQLHDHEVRAPADVYSLGVVLLEALRGAPSFSGTAGEILAQRLSNPLRAPEDLPWAWQLLLTSMLEEDPARRPTATEVGQLIVAPAYAEPWTPPAVLRDRPARPVALAGMADRPEDLTELAAGTALAPGRPAAWRADIGRWRLMIAGLIAAMVVLAVIAWLLSGPSGSGGAGHPGLHAATVARTSTTVGRSARASVASAAGKLVSDEQAGVAAGSVTPSAGAAILGDLGLALSDVNQHNLAGIGPALGAIDAAIAGGASSGEITAREASVLTADVSALAGVLRAPTIATTTTTTTAPPPPPPGPPPAGHHHGH